MGHRIREHDWAATPLGPVEGWPERLRGAVEQMLANPLLSSLAVGPERILLYNDAAARLYGDRHPGALGRPLPESWTEAYPSVAHLYERAFAGEALARPAQPLDVTRTGGEVFEAVLTPVRDADGTVLAVHMTGFEIGARLRAEAALRESEARYRAFVTASANVVYRMSPDWTEMRELDGRGFLADTTEPSHGWMGRYIAPEDQAWVQVAITEAIRAKTPFELEHRVRRADGTLGWTLSRAVPILDERGDVVEWLGAAKDVTSRRHSEEALRGSKERYRQLFERMDQGFCVIERVDGHPGAPSDYRYLVANPAFERHTGLRDPVGRTIRELVPEAEASTLEIYDEVARTGEPRRFEVHVKSLDLWMEAEAIPANGSGRIAVLFSNVSARKRVEESLRASEERQAFLLGLSDALRPLGDPVAVMAVASEALGRHLGVGRCGYGEVDATGEFFVVERDWTDGAMASFRGRHLLVSFGPEFTAAYRRGEAVLIEDALADARAAGAEAAFEAAGGVRASLGLPLIKDGRFVAGLFVQQVLPRRWSAQDEALAREVAERTWAAVERARAEAALRESEERLRTLFDSIDEGFLEAEVVMDADGRAVDLRYVALNPAFERLTGLRDMTGRLVSEVLPDLEPEWTTQFARVASTGEAIRFELPAAPLDRWFDVYVARIGGPGSRRCAVVYNDITARKRAEAKLRESEERNRFLLELGDHTRPLSDAEDVTVEATRALGEHLAAAQVVYAEMDEVLATATILGTWTDGRAPSLFGDVPLQAFGDPIIDCLRSGRTLRVDDTSSDPRTAPDLAGFEAVEVRAIISVPLLKGGRFVAALHVHRDRAWEWSDAEVRLIEAVAERTWEALERARAEAARADSEERLRAIIETASDYAILTTDPEGRI